MTTSRPPLHPLGALGFIALTAGLVAWLWTEEWRWAVTGLAVLLALAIVGAVLDARRKP